MSNIPPDLQAFVDAKLASGQFQSIDEVAFAAMRTVRDREDYRSWLKAEIQVGLDELDAGLQEPWDIDEIRTELRAELDDQGRRRV
jgi:putative addiction module CopG family antidote